MEHCLNCQGINIESLAQASGYQHFGLGNLRRSRKTCRMCDFLCQALEDSLRLSLRSDITDIWNDSWSLNTQLSDGPRPKLRLTVSTTTGPRVIEDLPIRTEEDDPAILVGIRPRLPLSSSTRSSESYAIARKWIRECLSGHPHVQTSGTLGTQDPWTSQSNSKDRPRRLVHVQPRGSGLLLMLTDALSAAQAYATLSHCWGAGPWTWITSEQNLHQRQVGFSEASLPPTIRDACFTALELNIPYIWVDCLCIAQDDADEWALEAPKMGSIYNGSIVTIAATSAASGLDGLFNTKSSSVLPQDPDQEITLETRLSGGSSSILRITRPNLFETEWSAWNDHITMAPLMQRAWVCQERMSSPRIIHYTSAQLFWECEHCTLSEDNTVVSSWGESTDSRPRLLLLSLYQSKISEEWDLAHAEDSWGSPLDQWYSDFIGDRYSRCTLTFKQDKLSAISGLAKLIHDKTSIPYFAGHWFPNERGFLSSLCWQRHLDGAITREHRAPSWSWASQDSAVAFTGVRTTSVATLYSRLMHLSTDNAKAPAAASSFGSLCASELVIEGPLHLLKLRHTVYTNTWNAHNDADANGTGPEFHNLDDDTGPPSDTLSYGLALTSVDSGGHPFGVVYFLILEEVQRDDTPTMKRIGCGITSTDREWARELLEAPVSRIRII